VIRPRRLAAGDRVAVVAPAGPVPRERFEAGARILAARYSLVHDERIFAKSGFLAGSDDDRLAELQHALGDPSVKAILCARGGYGLMRILPSLDPAPLLAAPKILVGFSDVTVLHAWAARAGVTSVHGPVVTQLADLPADDAQSLIDLLESPQAPPPVENLRCAAGRGIATGLLRGGNLELISRLAGTPWALALDGAVLLLEEIGERPYRIDRALTQLELSGAFSRLSGVVVGGLESCAEPPPGVSPTAEEVVVERLSRLGVPLLLGAPVGHGARNRALPLGVRVELDAGAGRLRFLEAPFTRSND
jgi:muramoyltetrapeptide carboxypeptidase